VKVGQQVSQGQAVGMEGSTGNSTGAHLHFELRINQKPVDPAPYLPPGAPSAFRG
jgi:murein DD-endopeptidase MepM/ murein hydrolase activator NlpD